MNGMVVWFTGLPSSGKSTLAQQVSEALRSKGTSAVVLDGDAVRAAIVPAHGYTDESRGQFYETLARLAALLASQGHLVLVPATANRRAYRARARALAPAYLEVFVDTPLEVCAHRDAKGLYRQHTAGLPGVSASFEAPEKPDVLVQPQSENAVQTVLTAIETAGNLQR